MSADPHLSSAMAALGDELARLISYLNTLSAQGLVCLADEHGSDYVVCDFAEPQHRLMVERWSQYRHLWREVRYERLHVSVTLARVPMLEEGSTR